MTNPESSSRVPYGKIGRPHAVGGEVRLWLFNNDSDLIDIGTVMQTKLNGEVVELTVESARFGKKFAIVAFEEIPDRETAEEFTNQVVSVDRSEFLDLDDGEFYQADLIGTDVRVQKDDGTTEVIGRVKGFLDPVSDTDILVVTGKRIQGRLLVLMLESIVLEMSLEGLLLAPLPEWAPADFVLKPEDGA